MSPEQRRAFCEEYEAGELPDQLLAEKYGLDAYQFKTAVFIGHGNITEPKQLEKVRGNAVKHSGAAGKLAMRVLSPGELSQDVISASANVDAVARDKSLLLSEAELTFANNVLRGINPVLSAMTSFDLFNKTLGEKKAAELFRASHVADYIASMKGQVVAAPLRNKAYLEAMLWRIADRSMELEQSYNSVTGEYITGKCEYDPKTAIAAGALIAKLKGWEKQDSVGGDVESQRDRLRRIAMLKVDKD